MTAPIVLPGPTLAEGRAALVARLHDAARRDRIAARANGEDPLTTLLRRRSELADLRGGLGVRAHEAARWGA